MEKIIHTLLFSCLIVTLMGYRACAFSIKSDSTQKDADSKVKVSASFTTTMNSRFIWRGLELGDHPHIQPSVTLSMGKFFVGAWASHGIGPVAFDTNIPGYKEVIPYIGYTFSSAFTLLILDHYNPNFGSISNFKDNGEGSNTIEARALFNFWKFDVLASINFYNDPKYSNYLEIGYNATLNKGIKIRPLVSFTPTESPFNGTSEFAFTQVGVITSKDFNLTKEIGMTLRGDFIVNPNADKFYAAFGVAFKL